ncbi:MAG: TetR family transcriptional regulator [Deltaproteobacteria bacterium]|nr:TetR family transcriptional regulator [Deltaproteobacteria bacterium]
MSPKAPGSKASRRRKGERGSVGLSRERVVGAALSLVEKEPRSQVTLSAVARELGVATMSLYTHVRSREDLVQAVKVAALRRFHCHTRPDDPWDRQLSDLLDAVRVHLARYPFLAFEPGGPPVTWPEVLLPLVRILKLAGLREGELAEATRWLGRVFWGLGVLEQHAAVPVASRHLYAQSNQLPVETQEELADVLPLLAAGTAEQAFDFSVGRAIAAVRDLIQERNVA